MAGRPRWYFVTVARVNADRVYTRVAQHAVPEAALLTVLDAFKVPRYKWQVDYFRYGDTLVRWDLV